MWFTGGGSGNSYCSQTTEKPIGGFNFTWDISNENKLMIYPNQKTTYEIPITSTIELPANCYINSWTSGNGGGTGPDPSATDPGFSVSGEAAIGLGNSILASGDNQTVIGKYNAEDSNKAFVIGNGSISMDPTILYVVPHRSNALTVDWSGNQVLAGKLTVGAAPTNSMDVTTKQYVDNIKENNEGLVANTYSNSSTYAAGAYAIYEHILYVCTTPVTVAEDFDDTKWTVVKLADRVNTAEGNIATLETTVGDSTAGLVHDVSDLGNRVSTLEGLTYSLSRPEINHTAIQDQTNFEIDANYNSEPIDVYVNGIRRINGIRGKDYTIVQGTSMKEVQFNTGLTAGDDVDITYIKLTIS